MPIETPSLHPLPFGDRLRCLRLRLMVVGAIVALVLAPPAHAADPVCFELDSPAKAAHLSVTLGEQSVACELALDGTKISAITAPLPWPEAKPRLVSHESARWRDSWSSVWGEQRRFDAAAQALVARYALASGAVGVIEIRLFDDGLGLRYRTEQAERNRPIPAGIFAVEVKPHPEASLYWPIHEKNPAGPIALCDAPKTTAPVSLPLVIDDRTNRVWMALLESDLFSARLFSTMKIDLAAGGGRGVGVKSEFAASSEDLWRKWAGGSSRPGEVATPGSWAPS